MSACHSAVVCGINAITNDLPTALYAFQSIVILLLSNISFLWNTWTLSTNSSERNVELISSSIDTTPDLIIEYTVLMSIIVPICVSLLTKRTKKKIEYKKLIVYQLLWCAFCIVCIVYHSHVIQSTWTPNQKRQIQNKDRECLDCSSELILFMLIADGRVKFYGVGTHHMTTLRNCGTNQWLSYCYWTVDINGQLVTQLVCTYSMFLFCIDE